MHEETLKYTGYIFLRERNTYIDPKAPERAIPRNECPAIKTEATARGGVARQA